MSISSVHHDERMHVERYMRIHDSVCVCEGYTYLPHTVVQCTMQVCTLYKEPIQYVCCIHVQCIYTCMYCILLYYVEETSTCTSIAV